MTPRILVVDDEVLIAMEIADYLEAHGFEVVGPCQSVAQALNLLAEPDCCDAAVLDASLRNESSQPVAQTLQALQVPFVVVSGYSAHQLPDELAAAPLLNKPVRTDDLIDKLRLMLA